MSQSLLQWMVYNYIHISGAIPKKAAEILPMPELWGPKSKPLIWATMCGLGLSMATVIVLIIVVIWA